MTARNEPSCLICGVSGMLDLDFEDQERECDCCDAFDGDCPECHNAGFIIILKFGNTFQCHGCNMKYSRAGGIRSWGPVEKGRLAVVRFTAEDVRKLFRELRDEQMELRIKRIDD